ncbi:MAG: ABC transporter substrate binding protein [Undibacterium sp.]|uniref:ABC transporter substrate-binding protein n=1 Tax=Undibacterium sp. TaxID=1914977 RepID=UPI002717D8E6|nr:ABC transporter substrate binding protein [Undibacterium sp.]MDO8654333.1 ABC transporter substrate binding protein [Undibacterium sp.]
MKKIVKLCACTLLFCALPGGAMELLLPSSMDAPYTFKIEVLQVTDIEPYQQSLDGFLKTLQDNEIVQGKNLQINRVKIDFDVEKGGFWDKFGVLLRIRHEAERITRAKPDLVLTIGSTATKYSRAILDDAHIPVVFTAVANPQDAGCTSLVDAGSGVTGATLYMDMSDSMKMVNQIFPAVQKIGMIHTDDVNGIAHVENARTSAKELGITISSKLVDKRDDIIPSLKELFKDGSGAQMFAVPLDTYYGLRNYEPTRDLSDFAFEYKIPVITFAMVRVPGASLYIGADFGVIGNLSGLQAVKILKMHKKPDVLPILRQQNPTILIDPERMTALNISLPGSILERKSLRNDGFWQIGAGQ